MALLYRVEDWNVTQTYDLVGGDGKFVPSSQQLFATNGLVTETFLIAVEDDTPAAVRAEVNALLVLLQKAREWHASQTWGQLSNIWLRCATEGEEPRRALIYDYSLSPVNWNGVSHLLVTGQGKQAVWQLAITRSEWWESPTDTMGDDMTGIGGAGEAVDLSAEATGQAPGRIARLSVSSPSDTFHRFWFGIHRKRLILPEDAIPDGVVDLTTAYGASATTIVSESGCVNGDVAQVGFDGGLEDWQVRAYGQLPDSGYAQLGSMQYTGRWLILLRARVAGFTAVMARVSVSAGNPFVYTSMPTLLTQGPEAYIETSNYRLYEMGYFDFPTYGRADDILGADKLSLVRLNLEARRVSGTGDFFADAFILIPADHLLTVTGVQISGTKELRIWTTADGVNVGNVVLSDTGSPREAVAQLSHRDWAFPHDSAVFICAFERPSGHNISDTANVSIIARPRWLAYHDD